MWCEFESVLPASHTCHTAFPPPPCPSWLSCSQANLQPPRLNPAPSHARSFPGIYRVVPKVARGLFCPAAPRILEHLWEAYEPLSWNRGVLAVCSPTEAQEYLLEPPCSLNSPTVDATRAGRPAQPPPSPDLMEVRCGQEEISYIAHSPWTPCLHVGPLSPLCDRVLIEHYAQITDEGIKLSSTGVTCGGTRCSWT